MTERDQLQSLTSARSAILHPLLDQRTAQMARNLFLAPKGRHQLQRLTNALSNNETSAKDPLQSPITTHSATLDLPTNRQVAQISQSLFVAQTGR
jgi:hypothetical protein